MKLYRYFYQLTDPFQGFTEMDLESPDAYVDYIRQHRLCCGRSYDRQYFENRIRTEQQLREEFIRQGGKPILQHPYYMVLGQCDHWFYDRKGCIGSLCIDLEAFDPDTVSFTYGDSVPALDPNFRKSRSYHGKVYTLAQLPALIEEYGLPQQWNPDELLGYETYIEVQIWAPMPVGLYRPGYGQPGSEAWQEHCTALCRAGAAANPKLPELEKAPTLFACAARLQEPRLRKVWQRVRKRLDSRLFCDDVMHGWQHALCCGLYMLLLGEQLPDAWLEAAVIAGMYHDIGRQTGTEQSHGMCSAQLLPGLFPELDPLRLAAVQTAMHMHCMPRAEFSAVWTIYSRQEPDEFCSCLVEMLRNADSLDYVRLGLRGYNGRFLTLEKARTLVLCAMQANLLRFCYPREFMKWME